MTTGAAGCRGGAARQAAHVRVGDRRDHPERALRRGPQRLGPRSRTGRVERRLRRRGRPPTSRWSRSAPTPAAPSACPAALNGVIGLRPTHGRVSNRGSIPVAWSFDTIGPLCRRAEDVGAGARGDRGLRLRRPRQRERAGRRLHRRPHRRPEGPEAGRARRRLPRSTAAPRGRRAPGRREGRAAWARDDHRRGAARRQPARGGAHRRPAALRGRGVPRRAPGREPGRLRAGRSDAPAARPGRDGHRLRRGAAGAADLAPPGGRAARGVRRAAVARAARSRPR